MKNKVHVKKGDTVILLTGKGSIKNTSKIKQGKVLAVMPDKNKVLVEGFNMATKHKKPRKQGEQGGIIHQEASIDSSNVMLVCPKCSVPTKVGKKFIDDGSKHRACKKCGEIID